MADRFEDLRNYVAVVSNGGINAAAEGLGIAKSAVSRRLGELEARLGVTLIDRTTRRFELTAVGRDYYRRAVDLLASLDDLDGGVAGEASRVERVRIMVDVDVLPELLVPALASFASAYERVTIEVTTGNGGTARHQGADVLIQTSPETRSKRESKRLGEFQTVLSGAPAYLDRHGEPAKVSDLADHLGVAVAGQERGWRFDGPAAQKFKFAMVVPDAASAAAAAINGAGLVQLPKSAVREAIEAGALKPLLRANEPPATSVHASFGVDCPVIIRRLVDHLAGSLTPQR